MLNGSADVGVLLRVLTDPLPDCVEVDDLWTGGIDVLMTSSSPLAELEKIGPTDLLDVAVVSELPPSPEPAGADVVWRCCQSGLVSAAVRARVGVGLVPALPRDLGSDLTTRPLADGPMLALSLVRSESHQRS
ncbi:hypothetical protein [Nocardioides alcanivorans]|uniref:hypothetical protein n=1 Tax=Nocardioides alcanivorans TaxID=2897352 RepID=UPI001F30E5E3|nr:hypothetical protein [Nocardioides alcanivorans]